MADVFISYHVSPGPSALVRNIADELESMGISCWYAPRNVTPGAFVPSILGAIACCKAFLMILDEGANGPGYVYNEMLQAFNRFKRERQPEIIPFKLGTFTTIPDIAFYLAPFHMFDGGMSAETAHIEELIHKISGLFHKAPPKIIKRGECGDNVTFTLDENSVLTISGTGPMWDFVPSNKTQTVNVPWWDERQTIIQVEIQNGVTKIGDLAFCYCNRLTSVVIPDSVTDIGAMAFVSCERLISVDIPDSITEIVYWTFQNCTGLKSVTIPDSVTEIGVGVFDGCTGLTSITIPNSVMKIRSWAFKNCTELRNVSISDSAIEIEFVAFQGCTGLTSVSIPDEARIAYNTFPESTLITRRE